MKELQSKIENYLLFVLGTCGIQFLSFISTLLESVPRSYVYTACILIIGFYLTFKHK